MSNENEAQEIHFGSHTARFEPPDLFEINLVGDLGAEDLRALGQFLKRVSGKFYIVLQTTHMGSYTTEAKKNIKGIPMASGIAIYGATRKLQIILSILNKVYMMVNLGKDIPLTFVSSEQEARQWVDYVRKGKAST